MGLVFVGMATKNTRYRGLFSSLRPGEEEKVVGISEVTDQSLDVSM